MGSITVQFCDLCKNTSEQLPFAVSLEDSDEETHNGSICKKCYEALGMRLSQEYEPSIEKNIPQVATPSTQGDVNLSQPTDEEGIVVVPSSYQQGRTSPEPDDRCKHPNGFTMGEDGSVKCRTCEEKIS